MSDPLLLGALLMGDPALVFALDPERKGSTWALFEEYAPSAMVHLARTPWPGEGPIYASVGARVAHGPLQRPVAQLLLPTTQAAGMLGQLDQAFPAEEFGAAEPCGEGCLAWPGARIPQPLVALAEEGALRLVFPEGSQALAPGFLQLLGPAEGARFTPSMQALLAEDTQTAALVRFEALQPWSLFRDAWSLGELGGLTLATQDVDKMWLSAAEVLAGSTALLSGASSEFEDLVFREVDEHWEIVGTLSELGVALRPSHGPVELPTWEGPEPELSVTAARDLALGLTKALPPFGIDPSDPSDWELLALERCGPGCALMLLGHPWSLLQSQTRDLLPGASELPVGVMEGFGFHGALIDGETVQGMSLSFSHSVRGGDFAGGPRGFEQRVWRRRHVQSGAGAPVKALFGGLEPHSSGVSLRSPAPPEGDLLAEVMTVASTPLFPLTLGDLELRSEGAVFTALPPGVAVPPLQALEPRTPADLEAQACIRDLVALNPAGALLRGDAAEQEAVEARWREASPDARARCTRLRGEDPVVRWMLGVHDMVEVFVSDHPEELDAALDALGRACRQGQGLACGMLRKLPAGAGVEALPEGLVTVSVLTQPWLILTGDEAFPAGGARCPASDRACMVEALSATPGGLDGVWVYVAPEVQLDRFRILVFALGARGLRSLTWVTPEGRAVYIELRGPGEAQRLRLRVSPTELRVDGRRVQDLGAVLSQRELAAAKAGLWLTVELEVDSAVDAARLSEVLTLIDALDTEVLELSWPP